MQYRISYTLPHKHLINIDIAIDNPSREKVVMQLPAWRPGRYELQNYAANIIKFAVRDSNNRPVSYHKTTRNQWEIRAEGVEKFTVAYQYFARQMDAGASWLDEEQLYLNFINCCMYQVGKEQLPCEVLLQLPDEYQIACGAMEVSHHKLSVFDYYQLADSPMIASAHLRQLAFKACGIDVHIWIMGEMPVDDIKILSDFEKFFKAQMNLFEEFPEKNYHFLFQILPYPHYHGVEHNNSTVICLGQAQDKDGERVGGIYKSLLGISSHELFHAWNICKIRPAELLPYDLTTENYFPTGFVAEGITTYYGDLMLARAQVWDADTLLGEISDNLQKHMDNPAKSMVSLVDSSLDLWVDGYQRSHPMRKVSIYDKGALVSLILDLELRKISQDASSLDKVMKAMWDLFGNIQKGYTIDDYIALVLEIGGNSFQKYFDECIYGASPLERIMAHALDWIGCVVQIHTGPILEDYFGLRLEKNKVIALAPGSPADKVLDTGDEILLINGKAITSSVEILAETQMLELQILRSGRKMAKKLFKDGANHFLRYNIRKNPTATSVQQSHFQSWCGLPFGV